MSSNVIRDNLMHSNGTTAIETCSLIIPSFFYTFIATTIISLLQVAINIKIQFILEFIILVTPIVLNISVFSKNINDIIVAVFITTVSLTMLTYNFKSNIKNKKTVKFKFEKAFVTNARSTINIMSVIAILAVDFRVFPRRFAKTEKYGFSLMDVGVGLFMYSNGIVSPEVLNKKQPFLKTLDSCVPLFILGGLRFLLTKTVDYHVPVLEYGVHWNFFITLMVTKMISSLIMNVVNVKYIIINAILLMFAHEALLQSGLGNYALSNLERDTFISANREGIVSSLGYVSLYLFSVYIGYLLDIKSSSLPSFKRTSSILLILTILTLSLCSSLNHYLGTSRRLANSAYCFFILFIGILMTGLYYVGENIQQFIYKNKESTHHIYSPLIFQSVNYNGLLYFLLGNVLTGITNILFNTLNFSDIGGLAIILLYMFINCLIVCVLYQRKMKLKF